MLHVYRDALNMTPRHTLPSPLNCKLLTDRALGWRDNAWLQDGSQAGLPPTEPLINLGQVTFPLCASVSFICRVGTESAYLQGLQ